MRTQVEAWQRSELRDLTAKVVIYEAFVEGKLEAPKHLARTVHDLYFEPLCFRKHNGSYEEFQPPGPFGVCRTRLPRHSRNWSRFRNFKAPAKLGEFLKARFPRRFNDARRCGPGRRSLIALFLRADVASIPTLPPTN
jgi:hypothetical protein